MTPLLPVVWQKNTQNNEWFDLLRLNLESSYFQNPSRRGVYAIWYAAPSGSRVIKIGSGNLAEQLRNLSSNPQILDFSKNGPLKVSWVAINGVLKEEHLAGVEAYLYDTYAPFLGEVKTNVERIPVNPIAK